MDKAMWEKAVAFHGHECPGLALGVRLCEFVQARLGHTAAPDEELVCIASVETRRHARLSHNATMGLSVRRRFWGLGIGSVCMELLIRFCRAHGGGRSLRLEVYADNERAIRLYKKFGFSVEGCRKRYLCVNGVYHDELLMCLML